MSVWMYGVAPELIEAGLDAVDHRAIVQRIAEAVDIHRRGQRKRPGAFGLAQDRQFEAAGKVNRSRQNQRGA